MKSISVFFLQAVVVLVGIVALVWLIVFPRLEGRAVNLDLFSIYTDPFIIFGYLASIPFFLALFQAVKLLGYVRKNQVFSVNAVRALRVIKYCAIILAACIVGAGLYILFFHHPDDDPAGFLGMSILSTLVAVVVATAAAIFEKILQKGSDLKSETDLTI